jgi:tetratricopeptide (TPR) repeat protein
MPDYEVVGKDEGPMLAPGEGKDHYDLGNVYREMRLWDAAVAEFEQARRDPTLRVRSTLALSECLQEMSNLQGALDLLESESRTMSASPQEQLSLHFQLGVVNELLGNLDEALKHFEDVHRQNSEHAEAEERIEALRRKKGAAV